MLGSQNWADNQDKVSETVSVQFLYSRPAVNPAMQDVQCSVLSCCFCLFWLVDLEGEG